jgi:hypothetical protein
VILARLRISSCLPFSFEVAHFASRPADGRAGRHLSEEGKMSDLNPQPLPPRRVQVQVPVEIMNDLESFQKVQASLLGRLGCLGCTSGIQFVWQNYENWVVDRAGEIHPVVPGETLGALREG